jgi:predicted AAA+ superfamily ATPase
MPVWQSLNLYVFLVRHVKYGADSNEMFEHFVITQCRYLADYYHPDYRFSYLSTKDGAEVDLVVERPGKTTLFIEIKSTDDVQRRQLTNLSMLAHDFKQCEAICLSRDSYAKNLDGIIVYPWKQGIKLFFASKPY